MGKKNPTTQRYGLSGTLLPNTILDAYGIYRAMESPECQTFGNSNTLFRRRYAIENPHVPGKMVIDYANTEDFSKRIAETTFYRKSEDILDLPPIMHQEVIVPMTPAEARLYKEIESDCCAVLEEAPGNAAKCSCPTNPIAGSMRWLHSLRWRKRRQRDFFTMPQK